MRLINKIAITIDGMLRNIIRNIIVISVLSLGNGSDASEFATTKQTLSFL